MEEFLNKRKSRLVAVSLLIILSVVVIYAGSRLYSQYREQVIRTEESQLLTMAGIVGNNLNSYMEQQLEEIDLFYSQEGMPEVDKKDLYGISDKNILSSNRQRELEAVLDKNCLKDIVK